MIEVFWAAYALLEEEGSVDGVDTTESIRVCQEWHQWGCPRRVFEFIHWSANRAPFADETPPPGIVRD